MKLRFTIPVVLIFIAGLSFAQQKSYKDKQMIITPDGKLLLRADGSIISQDYKKEITNQIQSFNDAPIGTPFSWDGNLGFSAAGPDYNVRAIAVSGSDVFVGGSFVDAIADANADHIVRYNQKNNTWQSLGTGLNNTVHAIAVSGNDVYVGGEFTDAGGNLNADYIARWDGSSWNALGTGLNDVVYAIAISNNNVFVGGDFTSAGGNFEADYIVEWNGTSWDPMGQLDGSVYALCPYGSSVFVGGAFTSSSDATADYFAMYDGTDWGSLGGSLNNKVYAIAVSDNNLYIGGAFTNADGHPNADAIARFDLSSFSGWDALGTGLITNEYPDFSVRSLAVSGDDLYAGGYFYSPYNSTFTYTAQWNGTTWNSLSSNVGRCEALALSGTDLFVGTVYGLMRWFGAYAEGLYSGVQSPHTYGTGFLEFNTLNDSTSISIELNSGSGLTGVFNVFCYENKPVNADGSILPIANHRWIIQQKGIPDDQIAGNIRIKIVDLPDSSGIIYPGSSGIGIFHRLTPGRGQFTDLTPWTDYDYNTGEYVTSFSGTGEFSIGLQSTIDGLIDNDEYGFHIEGQNMITSDGKTWYMKSDDYFFYIGISNYTNSSEAINFYLDNSGIYPVNYPDNDLGTITGSPEEGINSNLPFRADFFAYIKPSYDEYKYANQFGGWGLINSATNSFVKNYSDPNNVFEFAIPLSSLPVSTNQSNIPLEYYNWLGFITNTVSISSRVPSNINPSGIANDLVWYYQSSIYNSSPFTDNSYTHIGPSIPAMGSFNCKDFTFYSPGKAIDRTSGVWNIDGDLWMYDGILTFQNSDSVNTASFMMGGGTTNFSYGSSDAPLFIEYNLWQWELGGTININSGHYLTFVTPPFGGSGIFDSREVFQNIRINNPGGVHLQNDMKIKESLNLLNGNIQTITYDTFYVILDTNAVFNSSGGFINGGLVKYIPLSPGPNGGDSPDNLITTFSMGTQNGPSPVTIDFSSVTSPGKLIVEVYQNNHPNTVDSSEALNRFWRITKDNSLTFTTANITFGYQPEDFNGVTFVEANDEAAMVVGKYDAGSWSFPNISSRVPGGSNDGGSISVSGITSFSDFTFAKDPSALPVELESFTAKASGKTILLNWQTKTEVNNFGFNVERRINEGEWNFIKFIEGHGNSNSPKEYNYTDKDLFANGSKFQYRLKQIDTDGQFEYSDIVEVEVVPTQYDLSQNYPNPFNPTTTIRFSLPQAAQLKINLYNMLGELVKTLANGTFEIGYHKIVVDASDLPSGTYIYRLESSEFVQVKKMILLK